MAGGTCGSAVSAVRSGGSVLTTSFGVVRDDTGYIIDHGYGIQNVVPWLRTLAVERVAILQTHFHTDHVAALPLNSLLFQKAIQVSGIWSMHPGHMAETWCRSFDKLHWPVSPADLGIDPPRMHDMLMPRPVYACALCHPGGSTGFRISHGAMGDIVIATDHEAGIDKEKDDAYVDLVDGAALLVTDIQYRQSEYAGIAGISGGPAMKRHGWGHSTAASIGDVLSRCKSPPARIRVTHHDPMRDSADLWDFEQMTKQILAPLTADVAFLSDGDVVQF